MQISGDAGAGKTQLGMQLLLQVRLEFEWRACSACDTVGFGWRVQAQQPQQRGGLGRPSLVISTEGVYPVLRLRAMAKARACPTVR